MKNLLRPDELAALERIYAMCGNDDHTDACTAGYLLAERLRAARYEATQSKKRAVRKRTVRT